MKTSASGPARLGLRVACLWGTVLFGAHAAPTPPPKPQITAFTLYTTNGSLPPQYAHQEELRGQVSPRSVFATYTYTHYAPNAGKPGFHDAVFTWRGVLPAAVRRQYLALAQNVAFVKPSSGPPSVGGSTQSLGLTYAGGRHAAGVPTDTAGWDALLAAVALLAHSPKK